MAAHKHKFIALGLLILLFGGLYIYSLHYGLEDLDESEWVPGQPSDEDFMKEFFGAGSGPAKKGEIQTSKKELNYSVEAFENEDGWGYKIFVNERMVIDQAHIPAIQGIVAFFSKDEAEKTAELVISKIKAGIYPPTISKGELDSLGIKY
jgi:hypothetical protein